MEVAIYARRSRAEELEPGEKETSTEQQIRLCLKLASDRGWTVRPEHIYKEAGLSAYTGAKRGAFDDALDAVTCGDVQGIVFWKVDRATRNSRDTARLAELLDTGTMLASVIEGIYDPTSAMAGTSLELQGLFAKMYAHSVSVNAKRGKEALARTGKYAGGGKRPFGFAKDGITHEPAESALIHEAVRKILDGKSLMSIVRNWNDRGLTTTGGSAWDTTVLRRTLLGPRIAGFRQHRGEIIGKAVWDPILDERTWLDVKEVLTDPARRKGGHPHVHLLSGIAHCKECHRPLRGMMGKKRGKLIYVCGTGTKGRGKGSCGVNIDGVSLERHVTEKAIKWLSGPGLVGIRRHHAQAGDRKAKLVRQVQEDDRELRRLAELKAAGRFSVDEWLVLRDGIEKRLKATRRALRRHPATAALVDLPNAPDELQAAWEAMDTAKRRVILKAIIAKLEIAPTAPQRDDAGRWTFDAARVTLEFRGPGEIADVPLPSGDADIFVSRSFPEP